MEVIDMLDEREYLNKRKDYTGWNDQAEAADELVEDTAAEYARQESLEELAKRCRSRGIQGREGTENYAANEGGGVASDGERRSDRS